MQNQAAPSSGRRQPWVAPRLAFRGTVADILKSGGGKLSIQASDPGEIRCEKPHTPPHHHH